MPDTGCASGYAPRCAVALACQLEYGRKPLPNQIRDDAAAWLALLGGALPLAVGARESNSHKDHRGRRVEPRGRHAQSSRSSSGGEVSACG